VMPPSLEASSPVSDRLPGGCPEIPTGIASLREAPELPHS
jgi:hypothetical protein